MPRISTEKVLVYSDAVHAGGASGPLSCEGYKVAKFTIVIAGGYDGLLKFLQADGVTFTPGSSASDTNQFSPVGCIDVDAVGTLPGSEGIDFSGSPYNANGVYTFEIQMDGAKSLGLITSGATKGTIKAYMTLYDSANQ